MIFRTAWQQTDSPTFRVRKRLDSNSTNRIEFTFPAGASAVGRGSRECTEGYLHELCFQGEVIFRCDCQKETGLPSSVTSVAFPTATVFLLESILCFSVVGFSVSGHEIASDGSHGIIDALHHAAHRARTQGLEASRELMEASGASTSPAFATGLAAVLEVLPVSSTFTGFKDEKGVVGAAANDFDVLEHLRRLAYSDRVAEPQQLKLLVD